MEGLAGLCIALTVVALLLAGLAVVGVVYSKKLARATTAWTRAGTTLGLDFRPIGGKIGRLSGTLDGFQVEVDIALTTSGGADPRTHTYTRVKVHHPETLDPAAQEEAERRASAELAAAEDLGFSASVQPDHVRLLKWGMTMDQGTIEAAVHHALAIARRLRAPTDPFQTA